MLSYLELVDLVNEGVITNVQDGCINGSSIDVHLGAELLIEACPGPMDDDQIDPVRRENFNQIIHRLDEAYYMLAPSEFVLGSTIEQFNLPSNISAEFRLKSSGARSGLDNSFACHCDPGWHGSALTLERKNVLRHHWIKLSYGMPIGQIIFHRHDVAVPKDKDYKARGRYNGDTSVSGVKI